MASRKRWLEHQGKRVALQERWQSDWQDVNYEGTKAPPCPERRMRVLRQQGRKKASVLWEVKRKRCVAFEEAAKGMLKYLENRKGLKVSLSELKGQLDTPEEAG